MDTKMAKWQVEAYAKAHGLSVGDAYYQIQAMCEEHREVWDFGRVAGLDQAIQIGTKNEWDEDATKVALTDAMSASI